MNEAGSPQTKGKQVQVQGLSYNACLEKCEEHHAATGCEYISEKYECIIHTLPVKVTKHRVDPPHEKHNCIEFGMYFLTL